MATKTESTFRLSYSVTCSIDAKPEDVFAVLTDAARFTAWNSTLTRLEGKIAVGEKLAIEAKAAPGRTFRPKVAELESPRRMVWSDGAAPFFKGVRTFSLEAKDGGKTELVMSEEFAGIMLPMIKGSLPDFGPIFDQYVADLKREVERA